MMFAEQLGQLGLYATQFEWAVSSRVHSEPRPWDRIWSSSLVTPMICAESTNWPDHKPGVAATPQLEASPL